VWDGCECNGPELEVDMLANRQPDDGDDDDDDIIICVFVVCLLQTWTYPYCSGPKNIEYTINRYQ